MDKYSREKRNDRKGREKKGCCSGGVLEEFALTVERKWKPASLLDPLQRFYLPFRRCRAATASLSNFSRQRIRQICYEKCRLRSTSEFQSIRLDLIRKAARKSFSRRSSSSSNFSRARGRSCAIDNAVLSRLPFGKSMEIAQRCVSFVITSFRSHTMSQRYSTPAEINPATINSRHKYLIIPIAINKRT